MSNACNIKDTLKIYSSLIGSFSLTSLKGNNGDVDLFKNTIGEMMIELSNLNSLTIRGGEIEHLVFSDNFQEGKRIECLNITIGKLSFSRVENKGAIKLHELTVKERLVISTSDLGKTDFILCDFKNALLDFQNTKITEVFVAKTDFPKHFVGKQEEHYAQAQLAYGQLSQAFSKQGDSVRALEYQSLEIQAYYNFIRWRKNFATKFNLWWNLISTSFGRNWLQGVGLSFTIGILMFYFVVICSEEYSIGFPVNWDFRLLSSFFKFMNPLRFFDTEALFEFNNNRSFLTLTPGSFICDFFGRVLVAYFYYQTIQAFRRFGRK